MDPDVRSPAPGRCPRCGMSLVAGIAEPAEYLLNLTSDPHPMKPGSPVELIFEIKDRRTGERVRKFEVVHEKLFHLFLVSEDLTFFAHEHPRLGKDARFHLRTTPPKPGCYRVLSDFYPSGGTPQMISQTLFTAGFVPQKTVTIVLNPDLSPKTTTNLEVSLELDPPRPIAGQRTLLFFHLKPAEGLERYLGAWGHMLAASDDLVDLVHAHPYVANGGPEVQFNLIFPREAVYRIWVQFQRLGKVNTAVFDVAVARLK